MIKTIYIEDCIKDHFRTKAILSKFRNARKIIIDRYGEVFNRRNQSFRLQKKNPSLIIAKKNENFVLPVPEGFGFKDRKNYYFSHMYNCIYDCKYCFLQGMYSSANFVLFVNFEDFEEEIKRLISKNGDKRLAFFSGYDCDSLALEHITGFVSQMVSTFRKHPSALIEFRTKSIQIEPLISMAPIKNCVVAYSLMPELIAKHLDVRAPSVKRRINAMVNLVEKGWMVGFRFDPLIHGKDWKILYEELLESVFEKTPNQSIHSISFGGLRFPKKMYKQIINMYPKEPLFSGPIMENGGMVGYSQNMESEMIEFCKNISKRFVPKSAMHQCSIDMNSLGN